MSSSLPKLIVILGPTASGKTGLAIELAEKFNGEIVSADSRQIYRGMDIGTNKVITNNSRINHEYPHESKLEFKSDYSSDDSSDYSSSIREIFETNSSKIRELFETIPHHMIDIVNPDQEFTLAQYKEMAIKIIKDIQKRDKIPFLVGGTGLYIQAIVDNLQIPKVAPNEVLRKKLEALDLLKLLEMLKKIDPQTAEVIDIKNKRRLIRALEVSLTAGKTFSSLKTKGKPLFDCLQIGIEVPKEKLYEKINKRVDEMIEVGLVDEVKKLKEKYSCGIPSMSGIGYKEICQVLESNSDRKTARNGSTSLPFEGLSGPSGPVEGTTSNTRNNAEKLNKAIQLIKQNTRRYSRRQMTWFHRDKRIHWIESHPSTKFTLSGVEGLRIKKEAEKLIKKFLKNK